MDADLKKLVKLTYVIEHVKKYDQINKLLDLFKLEEEKENKKVVKKLILISAEKSVQIEGILEFEDIVKIYEKMKEQFEKTKQFKHLVKKENLEKLEICFDHKEKKTYIKGNEKIEGIFLYFITTDL